jgi:predicted nucleic acid-binding protein
VIYFDSAYLLKCYLPEPHAQLVRDLLVQHQTAASCVFARMEFASGIRRAVRESKITDADAVLIFSAMRQDDGFGLWTWLPLTPHIIEQVVQAFETLPDSVNVRTGDAVHLVCAREGGFSEIYSNDQHLLAAAPHFGLVGKNVIP